MPNSRDITREFVADAGKATIGTMVAVGAPLIVPRRVLGRGHRAPSDTVSLGIVGFGGMGCEDALVLAHTEHIAAVCAVDFAYSERQLSNTLTGGDGKLRPEGLKRQAQFRKAKRCTDFRELLAKEKGLDGVVIATPDHLHAVIAEAAMDLGKHANQYLTREYRAGWAD
jgi:Oxidoreductase family, NAD-binding Rossmann fold